MKLLYPLLGGIAALSTVFWYVSAEEKPKFHPNLGATILDDETWSASKRFKSLGDCNASGDTKDISIDWDKLDTYGAANVCLFFLFEQMDGPNEVTDWLLAEEFEVSEPYMTRGGTSIMKHFGYDPLQKVPSISAKWPLDNQAKKFAKQIITSGEYSQSIGVIWFPDKKLMRVKTLSNIN